MQQQQQQQRAASRVWALLNHGGGEGGRCRCWPLTEPADLRGLARRRSLRGDEDSAGTQQKIVVRPAPRRAVAARTQWVGLLPRTGAEAVSGVEAGIKSFFFYTRAKTA